MTLNGKRDNFQLEDFVACEKNASMKWGRGIEILKQVHAAVLKLTKFAEVGGAPAETARQITAAHRTRILPGKKTAA